MSKENLASNASTEEDDDAYQSASEEPGDTGHVAALDDADAVQSKNANADSKDEVVKELSEEEIKELKEVAGRAKQEGNDHFRNGDYSSAIECYSEALRVYPKACDGEKGVCDHERAVCYANRAVCHMKKESHEDVISDCSEALTLEPAYLKARHRRAQSYEALEKYEDALEDYKKVLELDPSQVAARQALIYLPDKIKEQHEKLKTEMLGKLKELGNAILNPFGLSTDNFQMQQDPNTGGYSINFKR